MRWPKRRRPPSSKKTAPPIDEGYVFDIKRDTSEDGPGIRTTVFLSGCPMRCVWCQNPEGVAAGGSAGASGTRIATEELLFRILIDRPFFANSGGGVTLSGGEPTFQIDFANRILRQLKQQGIHTAIETCGLFVLDTFEKQILPYVDLIYFDLKLFDDVQSKRYTGVSNRRILDNFRCLSKTVRRAIVPRIPLVPGVTTTAKNLAECALFLEREGYDEIELLPYNPTWIDKTASLGISQSYAHGEFMSPEEIMDCRAFFRDLRVKQNGR